MIYFVLKERNSSLQLLLNGTYKHDITLAMSALDITSDISIERYIEGRPIALPSACDDCCCESCTVAWVDGVGVFFGWYAKVPQELSLYHKMLMRFLRKPHIVGSSN